jgi:molybdopterin-binding protein
MKLSARNQIKGKILEVKKGATTGMSGSKLHRAGS